MPPHGCVQYDDGADLQLFISNMVPIYLGRNCTAVDVDISVAVNSTSTMAVPHALVTVIDAEHANPVEAWEARGSDHQSWTALSVHWEATASEATDQKAIGSGPQF